MSAVARVASLLRARAASVSSTHREITVIELATVALLYAVTTLMVAIPFVVAACCTATAVNVLTSEA